MFDHFRVRLSALGSLVVVGVSLFAGCYAPAKFCKSDEDCLEGEVCDEDREVCISAPDARRSDAEDDGASDGGVRADATDVRADARADAADGEPADGVADGAADGATDGAVDGAMDVGDGGGSCSYQGKSTGVCSEGRVTGTGDATGCQPPSDYQMDEDKCDDVDNDCDGVVDEMCKCDFRKTSKGVCSGGEIDPQSGSCLPPDGFERDETKCDQKDNDCDGVTDEGCNCDYDGKSDGVCSRGVVDDQNGKCEAPKSFEADESTCDAKDNDCDGTVDEGCSCTPQENEKCYTGDPSEIGVGECKRGQRTCDQQGNWKSCQNDVTPKPESCNDKDDDCDGVTDEGCACDYTGTQNGVCSDGLVDNKGRCRPPSAYSSSETTCDSKDNDCDGVTDENCPCSYKQNPNGVCGNASIGGKSGTCEEPVSYEQDETSCDAKDNDCDGTVDEGCNCRDGDSESCYTGKSSTAGTGVCKTGSRTCTNGSWTSCMNEVTPSSESCNGKDDDCDGVADEGCSCDYTGTSTGVCSDGKIDSGGNCQPPSEYSSSESTCDGLDNDCDGATDEGCPCNYKSKTDGVCGNATRNSNGDCERPRSYEMDESSCDAKDNDCDGTVDEGCNCTDGNTETCYTGPKGTKGIGQCKEGSRTCSGGTWGTCSDTTPSSETCDGTDNDCDKVTDEGCSCNYNQKSDGVCTGQTIDSNGDCTKPSAYEVTESTCDDGNDNDCDGDTDCADTDCGSKACGRGSGAVCRSKSCVETACEDDSDNDLNEGTDCEDSECSCGSGAVCVSTDCQEDDCGDGSDNDGDGPVDCDDADCTGKTGPQGGTCPKPSNYEAGTELTCNDQVDNDADGDTDDKDSDCRLEPGQNCSNGTHRCRSDMCKNGTCPHIIYVTEDKYRGDRLGKLGGADAKCEKDPKNGKWIAILSTSKKNAKDRFQLQAPVYNTNGDRITTNESNLWDRDIDNPVKYDHEGDTVQEQVWTGTTPDGTVSMTANKANTCSDWNGAGTGENGLAARKDAQWIDAGGQPSLRCTSSRNLYCLEVPSP